MSLIVVESTALYPEVQHTKGGGIKVLDTHKNLEWLLSHFKAAIRYNLMKRQREIHIPNLKISNEDSENNALALISYIATINQMPIKQLDSHLDVLALANTYHPIVDCIKQTPWDGIGRLDEFIRTIESTNTDLSAKIIKTWMVCAMAAAHSTDGFINNGVLVLQGEQNLGKTTWVRKLDPINCGAVKTGAFLDPANKDSVSQLSMYWIAELAELDCIFNKAEMGRLKSFITMDFDFIRLPYGRKATRLPRRSAYVATVNDLNYLTDETGNRRWWTIAVTKIHEHDLDMQQVWAEAYDVWQQGALTYLEPELQDSVNELNKDHEKVDPLKEKIIAFYDWTTSYRRYLTATEVLEELGYQKPTRGEAMRMGSLLLKLNNREKKVVHGLTRHPVPENKNRFYGRSF